MTPPEDYVKPGERNFHFPARSKLAEMQLENVRVSLLQAQSPDVWRNFELPTLNASLLVMVWAKEEWANVEILTNIPQDCALHWGSLDINSDGVWKIPDCRIRPPDSLETNGACQTPMLRGAYPESSNTVQCVRLSLPYEYAPRRIAFVIKEFQRDRYIKYRNGNFEISIPLSSAFKRKLRLQKEKDDLEKDLMVAQWWNRIERNGLTVDRMSILKPSCVHFFRQYVLGDSEPGELSVMVVEDAAVDEDCHNLRVRILLQRKSPFIVHWGFWNKKTSQWTVPPNNYWPPGSSSTDNLSVDTSLNADWANNRQWLDIFIKKIDLNSSVLQHISGIVFVLRNKNTSKWVKSAAGKDMFIKFQRNVTAGSWPASVQMMVEKILQCEIQGASIFPEFHQWCTVNRLRLLMKFISSETFEPEDADSWGLILVWLKFVMRETLPWQRGTMTRPWELGDISAKVTEMLVGFYRSSHRNRPLIRVIFQILICWRAGSLIREEVNLLLFEERHLLSVPFFEQWSKKLLANVTPQDVIVCRSICRMLRTGRVDDFKEALAQNSMTEKDLALFDPPITGAPMIPKRGIDNPFPGHRKNADIFGLFREKGSRRDCGTFGDTFGERLAEFRSNRNYPCPLSQNFSRSREQKLPQPIPLRKPNNNALLVRFQNILDILETIFGNPRLSVVLKCHSSLLTKEMNENVTNLLQEKDDMLALAKVVQVTESTAPILTNCTDNSQASAYMSIGVALERFQQNMIERIVRNLNTKYIVFSTEKKIKNLSPKDCSRRPKSQSSSATDESSSAVRALGQCIGPCITGFLTMHSKSEEMRAIQKDWTVLARLYLPDTSRFVGALGFYPTDERHEETPSEIKNFKKHLVSFVDRLFRCTSKLIDLCLENIQEKVDFIGFSLGTGSKAKKMFVGDLLNDSVISSMADVLYLLDYYLRKTVYTPPWRLLNDTQHAEGMLRGVEDMESATLSSVNFDQPTVLVCKSGKGSCAIPGGVVAVLVGVSSVTCHHPLNKETWFTLTSAVALQARKQNILMAVCSQPSALKSILKLEGKKVDVLTLQSSFRVSVVEIKSMDYTSNRWAEPKLMEIASVSEPPGRSFSSFPHSSPASWSAKVKFIRNGTNRFMCPKQRLCSTQRSPGKNRSFDASYNRESVSTIHKMISKENRSKVERLDRPPAKSLFLLPNIVTRTRTVPPLLERETTQGQKANGEETQLWRICYRPTDFGCVETSEAKKDGVKKARWFVPLWEASTSTTGLDSVMLSSFVGKTSFDVIETFYVPFDRLDMTLAAPGNIDFSERIREEIAKLAKEVSVADKAVDPILKNVRNFIGILKPPECFLEEAKDLQKLFSTNNKNYETLARRISVMPMEIWTCIRNIWKSIFSPIFYFATKRQGLELSFTRICVSIRPAEANYSFLAQADSLGSQSCQPQNSTGTWESRLRQNWPGSICTETVVGKRRREHQLLAKCSGPARRTFGELRTGPSFRHWELPYGVSNVPAGLPMAFIHFGNRGCRNDRSESLPPYSGNDNGIRYIQQEPQNTQEKTTHEPTFQECLDIISFSSLPNVVAPPKSLEFRADTNIAGFKNSLPSKSLVTVFSEGPIRIRNEIYKEKKFANKEYWDKLFHNIVICAEDAAQFHTVTYIGGRMTKKGVVLIDDINYDENTICNLLK
eukprot:GHVP01043125.1.p1 GENE.GHVP01043125.1~~GHVP01043125.1.p1  ORF type:complete len:1759 (+),score=303.58 GHVP01043125.1:291-5279(+)